MSQISALIESLKKLLRANNITYLAIAKRLDLSEASIKRMFSQHSFSLNRLNAICEMLEIDFIDLLRVFDDSQPKITHLSVEQEDELVADLKFLTVAVSVQNKWTLPEIVEHYEIDEIECLRYLIRLDKLGLIQLLPNHRIRTMVAQDFHWLAGGPIECFFKQAIQSEFLGGSFTGSGEQRVYLSGSLSDKSIVLLNKKLEMLANEFSELQNDDAKLPINARQSTGMMLAIRAWESSAFQKLRRN